MSYTESNNDFLSYEGKIDRKNYAINLLILVALFLCTSLINFNSLSQFFRYEFLTTVLVFIVELFKFILVIAILSVIYRRIADFSDFNDKFKKLFFIFYFFPFLYLNWGHYLFDFIPPLISILDKVTFFILLPLSIVLSIVFAFLKSKKY